MNYKFHTSVISKRKQIFPDILNKIFVIFKKRNSQIENLDLGVRELMLCCSYNNYKLVSFN